MKSIIGKKVGMTQVTSSGGEMWGVTVIQAGPVQVTGLMQKAKNGYDAVQLGFEDIKEKGLCKAEIGQFAKAKCKPKRHLIEFPVKEEEAKEFSLGQELGADIFEEGEFVDVHGRSIGKGFAGTIKRWNMHRGPESHGSMSHRRVGSIGASSYPSRTWVGHHMPGHMGDRNVTVQNLLVVKVMKEENVILLKGAVPGANNAILTLTKALKRTEKINLEASDKPKAGAAAKAGKKTAKKK